MVENILFSWQPRKDPSSRCQTMSKFSFNIPWPETINTIEISTNPAEIIGQVVTRSIPDGELIYEFDFPIRTFRNIAITSDGLFLVVPSAEGMKMIIM
ncbi:hypothetical protein Anas_04556 [Armadillidium nasatum]|uniref:NWD2 C-terminal beta-propeller domain-containing protein n=1 Tax=Armadillidium nasatum TaxID=96803 RepID=A0A5N5SME4_9CRUS|nr:hypothetical protein Anas_04556 [Armadillidium nasatum]